MIRGVILAQAAYEGSVAPSLERPSVALTEARNHRPRGWDGTDASPLAMVIWQGYIITHTGIYIYICIICIYIHITPVFK